jgi:hypothetical protein
LRSLWSFLAIPLGVVLFFLLLAVATYKLDSAVTEEWISNSEALGFLQQLFGDHESVRSLLSTIAAAMITVTSITFSLLLVAVQQAAASFSNQILQQFRHRKTNQFYFGFFVGLSLYTLITLVTVRNLHHPLFGALVAISMTVVALLIILILIYTTIEQMRGESVINEIARNIRKARKNEHELLQSTRRKPTDGLPTRFQTFADNPGYVNRIDFSGLREHIASSPGVEVVLCVAVGAYVGRGDAVAEVRSRADLGRDAANEIEKAVRDHIRIGAEPGLRADPRVGLEQLATIAWNSTSTAVSNPHPPALICRAVRELAWDWSGESTVQDASSELVYPDHSMKRALSLLEAIGVASAESKQPQTLGELYGTYAVLLPKVQPLFRRQIEEATRLSLGALPFHPPTQQLQRAVERLAEALRGVGSPLAELLEKELAAVRDKAVFEDVVSRQPS